MYDSRQMAVGSGGEGGVGGGPAGSSLTERYYRDGEPVACKNVNVLYVYMCGCMPTFSRVYHKHTCTCIHVHVYMYVLDASYHVHLCSRYKLLRYAPYILPYVTVSEKIWHSAQNMNFQLAVPVDSAKPAL